MGAEPQSLSHRICGDFSGVRAPGAILGPSSGHVKATLGPSWASWSHLREQNAFTRLRYTHPCLSKVQSLLFHCEQSPSFFRICLLFFSSAHVFLQPCFRVLRLDSCFLDLFLTLTFFWYLLRWSAHHPARSQEGAALLSCPNFSEVAGTFEMFKSRGFFSARIESNSC